MKIQIHVDLTVHGIPGEHRVTSAELEIPNTEFVRFSFRGNKKETKELRNGDECFLKVAASPSPRPRSATRQAVVAAAERLQVRDDGEAWRAFAKALEADRADERRRAVAALGCARWSPLAMSTAECRDLSPEVDQDCEWCAPCRAQAEIDETGGSDD